MPQHKVDWLVEKRVIKIDVVGKYEIETVREVVATVKILADASTPPMHVVWDISRLTHMTRDLRQPINEMNPVRYHPHVGWIMLITNDAMMRFAGEIVSRFLGANYRGVSSFDEALATLCRVDPTLVAAFEKLPAHPTL